MEHRIRFATNLDDYSASDFPSTFHTIPNRGDYVEVRQDMKKHIESCKLPTRLEVFSVTHKHHKEQGSEFTYTVVELWYAPNDYKLFFPDGLQNRR